MQKQAVTVPAEGARRLSKPAGLVNQSLFCALPNTFEWIWYYRTENKRFEYPVVIKMGLVHPRRILLQGTGATIPACHRWLVVVLKTTKSSSRSIASGNGNSNGEIDAWRSLVEARHVDVKTLAGPKVLVQSFARNRVSLPQAGRWAVDYLSHDQKVHPIRGCHLMWCSSGRALGRPGWIGFPR